MMTRDMELIRELLLRFEQNDQSVPPGRTQKEVAYHVHQMKEAGLIDAIISFAHERGQRYPGTYHIKDITPKGHDFIAAIRDDRFWLKLKTQFPPARYNKSLSTLLGFEHSVLRQ